MGAVIIVDDSAPQEDKPVLNQRKGVKRKSQESGPQSMKKSFKSVGLCSPAVTAGGNQCLKLSTVNTNVPIDNNVGMGRNCRSVSFLESHSPKTSNPSGSKVGISTSQQQKISETDSVPSKIPPCPTHKKKCNMKEVHKKGDNYGRWFFSCPLRSCNFFEVRNNKTIAKKFPAPH